MTVDADHRDEEAEQAPITQGTKRMASSAPKGPVGSGWQDRGAAKPFGCLVFGAVFVLFLVLAVFVYVMVRLQGFPNNDPDHEAVLSILAAVLGGGLVVVGLVVALRAATKESGPPHP